MNFLETILDGLRRHPGAVVLQEATATGVRQEAAGDLLEKIGKVRNYLRGMGLRRGDRCALVAANGIEMVAADLGVMAEGLIKVPLYTRQAAGELVEMMLDCGAKAIVVGDDALRRTLQEVWAQSPPMVTLDEIFQEDIGGVESHEPVSLRPEETICIIYTSGTSGTSKGVMLSVANLDHMLPCTMSRLDSLMRKRSGQERVFHYLPFCFAGSWILLLTSLTRRSLLTLCTDLDKLAEQMPLAKQHYFLNVPILLDRIRSGIQEKIQSSSSIVRRVFQNGQASWERRQRNEARYFDGLHYRLAKKLIFDKIRRKISPNLVAIICGSAPLSVETQRFFEMMGISILQVYGLTETTAICTMDKPEGPRRMGYVGCAIDGIEMKLSGKAEILVRGDNVFSGYWNRPDATAAAFEDGWFRTGDQGEVDSRGNWRIIGRVKNIIVLSSGHNVAPDPLEEKLRNSVPNAEQVLVVGHEKKHLAAVFTGNVDATEVDRALAALNEGQPHYKQVRRYLLRKEPFTIDNGELTANGKLRRQKVIDDLKNEIQEMYA